MSAATENVRREGARACIRALRHLIEAAAKPCGDEAADYYNKRHEDAKAFTATLGSMPPHIEGVILALAEIFHMNETTGEPDLEFGWLPFCAMTNEERAAKIAEMKADMEEDRAEFAAMHKVTLLRLQQ